MDQFVDPVLRHRGWQSRIARQFLRQCFSLHTGIRLVRKTGPGREFAGQSPRWTALIPILEAVILGNETILMDA